MIRSFLDLSTGHLTPATRQRFEDGEQLCGPVYPHPEGFGWFVWVGEHGDDATDAPADLVACFNRARKERCEYICFDCDAPMIDQLPIYEDEPPAMTYEAAAAAQAGARLPVEELRPDLKQISETANDADPGLSGEDARQFCRDVLSVGTTPRDPADLALEIAADRSALIAAAHDVIDLWATSRLAEAVNALREAVELAEQTEGA